jgi:hypothetical protein
VTVVTPLVVTVDVGEQTGFGFAAMLEALRVRIPQSAARPKHQAIILRLGALSLNMCVNIYV